MKPVLILGAGINGAAVARDLAINGIPVCIVDTGDVAGGATSRSSRLIHGGLRYLEYRDTALVCESLFERERLLKLAPHFVKPLRLTIPVERRFGGLWAGFVRFSGLARTPLGHVLLKFGRGPRGLIAIKAGLTMYDRIARSDALPPHTIETTRSDITERSDTTAQPTTPRAVTPQPSNQFGWLCSYSDAQIEYPERFVLSMLEDARRAAAENQTLFEVLPYHKATASRSSDEITITPVGTENSTPQATTPSVAGLPQPKRPLRPHRMMRARRADISLKDSKTIAPSVIVNATGAWGDRTLKTLGVRERKLFAGTKGSHLFTRHQPLIDTLNGSGIYAEANDGRMVFIVPCAGGVLIGTTDDPFDDDPANATATSDDVDYLLKMVSDVYPNIGLTPDDVVMHHAGVRPLPNSDGPAAAIPRGHSIKETKLCHTPILTLIGGKLTTCRSLAEEVTQRVCRLSNQQRNNGTASRCFPGIGKTEAHSLSEVEVADLARTFRLTPTQVTTIWSLAGNRFGEIFSDEITELSNDQDLTESDSPSIDGTNIPLQFVRWSIRHEWCSKLEDLVERRLMLIFDSSIHKNTLHQLAAELAQAGKLPESQIDTEVDKVCARLQKFYGMNVVTD